MATTHDVTFSGSIQIEDPSGLIEPAYYQDQTIHWAKFSTGGTPSQTPGPDVGSAAVPEASNFALIAGLGMVAATIVRRRR